MTSPAYWWLQGKAAGPAPPVLSSLMARGTAFYDADGIWKYHGASWFCGFRQWLDGVDQAPLYTWARALGVNILRIFTRLSWAGLRETDYTDAELRAYAKSLLAEGFYGEFVALADCAVAGWKLDLAGQRRHVARVDDVLGDLPHPRELANENTHPTNRVDALQFARPARGLWSRGSSHGDQYPIMPVWDYSTIHTPRDDEWPRKARHGQEWSTIIRPLVPWVADEPNRIDGTNLTPWDCFDYAAVADLLSAGSTIHTESVGKRGQLPTDEEQARCEAWAAAWRAVPPEAQLGRYSAGHLGDSPLDPAGTLQVYATIRGNRADAVAVRPTLELRARPGWRIAQIAGHVVSLEAV